MTKDTRNAPPAAGGSYVIDAKGKLTRKAHTAPAPDRAELRRRAQAAKPESGGDDAAGNKES